MEQENTLTAKDAKGAEEDLYRGFTRMHADCGKKKILPLMILIGRIFTDERWNGSVQVEARIAGGAASPRPVPYTFLVLVYPCAMYLSG